VGLWPPAAALAVLLSSPAAPPARPSSSPCHGVRPPLLSPVRAPIFPHAARALAFFLCSLVHRRAPLARPLFLHGYVAPIRLPLYSLVPLPGSPRPGSSSRAPDFTQRPSKLLYRLQAPPQARPRRSPLMPALNSSPMPVSRVLGFTTSSQPALLWPDSPSSPLRLTASSPTAPCPLFYSARLRTFSRREFALCGARSFPVACRVLCSAELPIIALLLPAASLPSSTLSHSAQPAAPRPPQFAYLQPPCRDPSSPSALLPACAPLF
jgi:hypothetical protein